ncbi:coiled-coil domain-containing protein 14 isoform X2 [Trichosurus vulpecula]|uniref:coiled-coil domain-containing protein 14 isoform X2 n=1 Tax=Trichosurus vulpecula TaxID=9337 RepID=UPI00186B3A76|nr:coiled-coil domain-containing protein 14 isoform X2 [Trichosurus vulpecula]
MAVNSVNRLASGRRVDGHLKTREMVRSGPRPAQVSSSGRQIGSSKLTAGKKRIHMRKTARTDADSHYSLYSTDSDEQPTGHASGRVGTVPRGLERCTSLLQDILQNEETTCGNPGKGSSGKLGSRPWEYKGNKTNKKGQPKNVIPSCVRKEILSSGHKKHPPHIVNTENEKDLSSTKQIPPIQVPFNFDFSTMYKTFCEHVQTQMSLINAQSSQSVSDSGPPVFNYGISTSTPVLPSRDPTQPSDVQSEVQASLQNGTVSLTSPNVPAQTIITNPHTSCLPTSGENKPTVPVVQPLVHDNGILATQEISEQLGKEINLLKCIQASLDLLHPHQIKAREKHQNPDPIQQPTILTTEEEDCSERIWESSSDDEDLQKVEIAAMQDLNSSRCVQKTKSASPKEASRKIRTLKYLLGELKALVAEQGDSEIQRLIKEVGECVALLPEVAENTQMEGEIALAMQTLRSENVHLRRRLKALSQRLREQEKITKSSDCLDCNFELISTQSLNMSLHTQLKESLSNQKLLKSKNDKLLKVIESQKEEYKKYVKMFQEKDKKIFDNKKHFEMEIAKIKIELEEALANVKTYQFKLETCRKENKILDITLHQREAEIIRLKELTRTLQNNMTQLLTNLSVDDTLYKPKKVLTKSLLDMHEKHLQCKQSPPRFSMSHLKELENDQIYTHTESSFLKEDQKGRVPVVPYENFLNPEVCKHKPPSSADEVDLGTLPYHSKILAEIGSETDTLIDDEYRPNDETIYLPFAISSSKKKSSPERISPLPPNNVSNSKLSGSSGIPGSEQQNELLKPISLFTSSEDAEANFEKFPNTSSLKSETEVVSEKIRAVNIEDEQLLMKIREVISKIPADFVDSSTGHNTLACQTATSLLKNSTLCDYSFLNSDLMSRMSDWSMSSLSSFTSHDEQDFRNGLAALDANITRLQKTLQTGMLKK